jgi:hypothetical protein
MFLPPARTGSSSETNVMLTHLKLEARHRRLDPPSGGQELFRSTSLGLKEPSGMLSSSSTGALRLNRCDKRDAVCVDFSCYGGHFRPVLFTVVSPNSLRFRCGGLAREQGSLRRRLGFTNSPLLDGRLSAAQMTKIVSWVDRLDAPRRPSDRLLRPDAEFRQSR